MLIHKGANIHVKNNDGNTVLLLLAENKYSEFAAKLIGMNADVNIYNKKGFTALCHAKRHNDSILQTKLLQHASKKMKLDSRFSNRS